MNAILPPIPGSLEMSAANVFLVMTFGYAASGTVSVKKVATNVENSPTFDDLEEKF